MAAAAAPQPNLGVLLFLPYRHMEQRILEAVAAAGHPKRAIEEEWRRHLGGPATDELERILVRLREITDPFA